MFNAWTIDQLQRASAAQFYKRTISTFGQRTFFLSLLFLFIGFISLNYLFAAIPLFVISLWLMIYAAAMIFLSPVQAFRIGDSSGIIAFLINIALIFYETRIDIPAPGQLPRGLPSIMIMIIGFGFIHFTYKRTVKFAPPVISQNEEAQFKNMIASLVHSDYRTDERIISVIINKTSIKGVLENNKVVLIANKGQEVSIFSRHDLEIVSQITNPKSKENTFKIRFGQQWVIGYIDDVSYQRYQQWKSPQ